MSMGGIPEHYVPPRDWVKDFFKVIFMVFLGPFVFLASVVDIVFDAMEQAIWELFG